MRVQITLVLQDEDWAVSTCPFGQVLRNRRTGRPITCSMALEDDEQDSNEGGSFGHFIQGAWKTVSSFLGIGKEQEKVANVCPQTHKCHVDSKVGMSVCCPVNTKGE